MILVITSGRICGEVKRLHLERPEGWREGQRLRSPGAQPDAPAVEPTKAQEPRGGSHEAAGVDRSGTVAAARRADAFLRGLGVRPTGQRVRVLAELMRERDDVTAQALHDRFRRRGERIGLATVYRTLTLLAGGGAVDALSHHRGELCYRWCGDEHHHHLVCSSCHRVVEVGDCELDAWLDQVAANHGFVATGHRLEVTGLCADCR